MSSAHTLTLGFDWDLHVDPAGNLPVSFEGYSIAQNVANALAVAGIDATRVELVKPVLAAAGSDPAEARRVEVTVR